MCSAGHHVVALSWEVGTSHRWIAVVVLLLLVVVGSTRRLAVAAAGTLLLALVLSLAAGACSLVEVVISVVGPALLEITSSCGQVTS